MAGFTRRNKKFSKKAASSNKIVSPASQTKLKILLYKIHYTDDSGYIDYILKLCQGEIAGAIIKSRCDWFEQKQKSSKLEKVVLFKIK